MHCNTQSALLWFLCRLPPTPLFHPILISLPDRENLRARIKADLDGQPVFASYTIAEVFARLKKIQLVDVEGKKYLINVSAKEKKLIKALGFEGLYDTLEVALEPLMRLA